MQNKSLKDTLNYIVFLTNLGKKGALVKERLRIALLSGKYGAKRIKGEKDREERGASNLARPPTPARGPVLGTGIRAPANHEGSFPRGGRCWDTRRRAGL